MGYVLGILGTITLILGAISSEWNVVLGHDGSLLFRRGNRSSNR